jgi:hypothetical protein
MLRLRSFRHRKSGDLVLGQHWKFPISPVFTVPLSARSAHLYVIGMSGKVKSQ